MVKSFILSFAYSIAAISFVLFEASGQKLEFGSYPLTGPVENLEEQKVDFRYAPLYWQSIIGLPSDPHKTVIANDGTLLYNFDGYVFDFRVPEPDYKLRIRASLVGTTEYTPYHQELHNAKTPIMLTESSVNGLTLYQTAFARAPEYDDIEEWAPRRIDYLWARVKNETASSQAGQFQIEIENSESLYWDGSKLYYAEGNKAPILTIDPKPTNVMVEEGRVTLQYDQQVLKSGASLEVLVSIYTAKFDQPFNHYDYMYPGYERYLQKALALKESIPDKVKDAQTELDRAISYWGKGANLPYGKIEVPDKGIQNILDASIRNIYQASELLDGDFIIQIGPGHYRGSWAADGPFFMESLTYLGEWKDARVALESQFDNDTTDPAGLTFFKRSGLRLWMVKRHAELTGDKEWLQKVWPKVERDVELIKSYRDLSRNDDTPLNDGLMPRGAGDGGLGGRDVGRREAEGMSDFNEYTNVYWNLAGLKSAVAMAKELNLPKAKDWEMEFDDFFNTYQKAAERDMIEDAFGNKYVPVTMRGDVPQLPQRGAWAFMHSVHPGEVFDPKNPILVGMMDMLDDAQRQGTVFGTGWLAHGIWNYFASMYAHAHLWMGHGRKAGTTLYAFSNHASPTYVWVEEQYPVGQMRGEDDWGDMPHNWASAEYIRLVRHLLAFERGNELHLLEGMPTTWSEQGSKINLNKVASSFGEFSMVVEVADDGLSSTIDFTPPIRNKPGKIVLHLEHFQLPIWKVTVNGSTYSENSLIEIPTDESSTIKVDFYHDVESRYKKHK